MLLQIIPTSWAMFAVTTDEQGSPEFIPIACLGLMDADPQKGIRVVTGFPLGAHLEPAEARPNFVGYAADTDPEPWAERCKAKRAEMTKAEADAKKPKLYVPEKKAVGAWQ